ncbi:MAG: HAD family hydrolase [Methylomicrobium sp.]
MTQAIVYALDFDGVICDSAVETAMTGWKAACRLWPDMSEASLSKASIDCFRRVRPAIETGYEAIIAMRLIHLGISDHDICVGLEGHKQRVLDELDIAVDDLKRLFGEVRDRWIHEALDEWLAVNPLFDGIAEKLRNLTDARQSWWVVTTKQERFVRQILNANRITLSDDRIFGLDRNKSKERILLDLVERQPEGQFVFVEDRLPTLINISRNPALESIRLQLADWGYNTEQDRLDAVKQGIELIGLDDFLVFR